MIDPVPWSTPDSQGGEGGWEWKGASSDGEAARPGSPPPGEEVHRRAVGVLRRQMGPILLFGAVLAGLLMALGLVLSPA